jgi:hypothetical protein
MGTLKRTAVADLAGRILDKLSEAGETKITILRALAKHWGYSEKQFEVALELLKVEGRVRRRTAYGGPRYVAWP